jgi:signal transduction histidine kinase
MRLSDLPRTTSFRLSALFLALFGLSSLLLFVFLYMETDRYMLSSVDGRRQREAQADLAQSDTILSRLQAHALRDPEDMRPFGLFDAGGHALTSQIPQLPRRALPFGRTFEFTMVRGGHEQSYRGEAYRVPSGDILVLSENIEQIHELRRELLRVMGWGSGLMLLVGLGGALLAARASERRISDITGAIERIVSGDLAERLPTGARSGDLDRLAHLVNGMLDDIERLMREVKGVTDDIAHDLRTPLTRLLARLERAQRHASSRRDYDQAVGEAIAEMQALLGTFSGLLRIAEVEDGARRAGFTRVDLGRIAADVTEFHAPVAEEMGLTLKCELARSVVEMSGDPSLLFEAVSNLVDNALKFTPGGGQVRVRTFRSGARVGVVVEDDGPGIPEGEREAVLQRFHRLEKSRHAPGSGLGLSLVAAVAKLHGLALTIASASPGCRVTLAREESLELPPVRPAAQGTPGRAAMAS